jgi:hypothetical protein
MEKKSLTLDVFKNTLGERYAKYKGKFKESKFDALLDELHFEESIIGREDLLLILHDEGFFEAKGKWIVCILLH